MYPDATLEPPVITSVAVDFSNAHVFTGGYFMRLTFYADKPNEARTAIMVRIALSGRRLRFGTGISIDPRFWNKDRQEVRSKDPDRNANARKIESIGQFIRDAYNDMVPSGKDKLLSEEDLEKLQEKIHGFLSPLSVKPKPTDVSFVDTYKEFIDTYTVRTRSGQITSRRPGPGMITQYKRCLALLQEWSTAKRKPLGFLMINEDFYTSFWGWLVQDKGLRDSSVSEHIKVLKLFMKWSRKKGYHATAEWESFWRDKRTGEQMALTIHELRKIRDVDLTGKARLSRTRDHFLLQFYTGMRYGDLSALEPRHFDEEAGLIRYTSEKSDTKCIVPITKPLRQLLERYPSRMFEFPSIVKANLYLKELGVEVGLTDTTTVSHYQDGKRIDEIKRRADLLTTHVARRSFSTTSVQFGLSEAVISRVTGHAARGVLQQHYIILSDEAVRDMVCKAWEQL